MSEFLENKARENAKKQIERRNKRVYTGLDALTYEATEMIIQDAMENGIIESYKYHSYGYFLVIYC